MPRSDRSVQPAWVLARRRILGDRIRAARINADMTQQDVYEPAGMDRTTYQRVEAGTSDPRFGDLLLVAHAIGVCVGDLVSE